MEESGENWPSQYLEEEGFDDDDEGDSFYESADTMNRETERKQKQLELSEGFRALSATIPATASKKMDKTSILDNASKYVKQLEQLVRELEQQVQHNICGNSGAPSSSEVNSNNGANETMIPEVKVKVLHKDVLIIIHCEKQKGVMLKVLSLLENINLSVVNTSVLRFGNSTLDITITAQMGDGYNMEVDELVRTLRAAILTQ